MTLLSRFAIIRESELTPLLKKEIKSMLFAIVTCLLVIVAFTAYSVDRVSAHKSASPFRGASALAVIIIISLFFIIS